MGDDSREAGARHCLAGNPHTLDGLRRRRGTTPLDEGEVDNGVEGDAEQPLRIRDSSLLRDG